MKYASIIYPNHLGTVDYQMLGFHFVLGQQLRDERYWYYYRQLSIFGHFIMVDNGAAESGEEKVPFYEIVSMAHFADEFIMPDKLRDSNETLVLTAAALSLVPPVKRAMCPQGSNWDEWIGCLTKMLSWGSATICIPKHLEDLPGGRIHALDIILRMGLQRTHNIHLLGVHGDPKTEVSALLSKYGNIRSIDSGVAMAKAQGLYNIDGFTPKRSIQPYSLPRAHAATYYSNVMKMCKWCNNDYND